MVENSIVQDRSFIPSNYRNQILFTRCLESCYCSNLWVSVSGWCTAHRAALVSLTVNLVFWWMFWRPEGPTAASGDWIERSEWGTCHCFVQTFLQDKEGRKVWLHRRITHLPLRHFTTVIRKLIAVWLDSAFRVHRRLYQCQMSQWRSYSSLNWGPSERPHNVGWKF